MNCASARNRLLTHPDPAAVPDAAGHLATCAGCQSWHRLLNQVELAVATAPVPATTGRTKRRLIELFRTGRTAGESRTGVVVPAATSRRERLAHMWPAYESWCRAGDDPTAGLRASYLELCDTVGRDVTLELPGVPAVRGKAIDVDEDGRLVLSVDGDRVVVSSGEVRHVRTVSS